MRLSKTTIVHFSGQVIVSLAGFGATFAIAVLEGSTVLGRYAIAVSLGAFLLVVPMQAVGEAIKKRISEGEHPESYFTVGVLTNLALAAAMAAGIVGIGIALRSVETPSPEIVTVVSTYDVEIALLVVTSAAFRTVRGGLEGTKRVGTSGLLQAAERVVRASVQVGVLLAGFSVAALVAGHGVALLVASVAGVWILGLRGRTPTREQFRSVYEYARYAWLGTLRTRVFGWFDTLVLSFFVSGSLVGIYEAAWGIAALLGIVSLAIRHTLFPEVSDLSARDDYAQLSSILEDGLVFSGIFAIPGLFGAAVIGQRVLRFYRPEFGQGAGILLLLICAYAAEAYGSQFVSVINAVDRPSLAYRINLVFILASIVLTTSLAWAFGWYGAAVATASASVLRGLLGYRILAREIGGVPVPIADIGRQVFAATVMAVAVFPMRSIVPSGRTGTLVLVGIGAALYVGTVLIVSKTVRDKTRSLFRSVASEP